MFLGAVQMFARAWKARRAA